MSLLLYTLIWARDGVDREQRPGGAGEGLGEQTAGLEPEPQLPGLG